MKRPDLTVADLGELATVYTADLVEGANAWVVSDGAYWTLEKNSGAALGSNVIAPLGGAPAAGGANVRWVREAGVSVLSGVTVADFTANASLLTAVDQFMPVGNGVATTAAPVRPYIILPSPTYVRSLMLSYEGSASNVAGQTATFAPQISIDHGANWADIPGLASAAEPTNLAGFHADEIDLATRVLLPAGTLLSARVTPSAGLTAALSNISLAVVS